MEPTSDLKEIKTGLLKQALTDVLDTAKVPMRVHLRVLEAFHSWMEKNKVEHAAHLERFTKLEQEARKREEKRQKAHEAQLQKHHKVLEELASKDFSGAPGAPGKTPTEKELVRLIKPLIPAPIPGEPGKDAPAPEVQVIVSEVLKQIVVPPTKESAQEKERLVTEIVTVIRDKRLIDAKDIKGLQGWVKDGVRYRFEELMHGAGSVKGTNSIVGVVNGINLVFTAATTPTIVFTEGGHFVNGFGVTISGLTITFDAGLAPQQWVKYV